MRRHAAAPDGAHRMVDLETPGRPGAAGALQLSRAARREPPRSSAGRRASHGQGAAQAVGGRSRTRGQLYAGRCLMSVPLNAALHLFSNSEPPRSSHTAAPRREIVLEIQEKRLQITARYSSFRGALSFSLAFVLVVSPTAIRQKARLASWRPSGSRRPPGSPRGGPGSAPRGPPPPRLCPPEQVCQETALQRSAVRCGPALCLAKTS